MFLIVFMISNPINISLYFFILTSFSSSIGGSLTQLWKGKWQKNSSLRKWSMALHRSCLVHPPVSLSRHFFLEQHHKLLSLRKSHQVFHLDSSIAHNCRTEQCLILQIIMHKNSMQKHSTVIRTNRCFVDHFSNFWKTLEDCLMHFNTSLMNVLKSKAVERNFRKNL